MSKIVTQDKLNELTGMSIDYGKGGDCPTYKEIIDNWGAVFAISIINTSSL